MDYQHERERSGFTGHKKNMDTHEFIYLLDVLTCGVQLTDVNVRDARWMCESAKIE